MLDSGGTRQGERGEEGVSGMGDEGEVNLFMECSRQGHSGGAWVMHGVGWRESEKKVEVGAGDG